MTIYEVNKLLSSENKSKIIAHFHTCMCGAHDVTYMMKKLEISQSNLSKHLGSLLKLGVLTYKQVGKERYYTMNKKWRVQWKEILEPQVMNDSNISFTCTCNLEKSKNDKCKI